MQGIVLSVFANGGCNAIICPTVYKSSDGRYFVQGYKVSKNIVDQARLADNEAIIEVDPQLILNVAKQVSQRV
jgi:hypothetical protein